MSNGATRDVIIVGAGPYGLSAAGHLRAAGLDTAIFGEPMIFWQRNMPKGMLLRSPYPACNIDAPGQLTLDDFARATQAVSRPVPLGRFVEFGRWVQQAVAPDVDPRLVSSIARPNGHFEVTLEDGETLSSRRVVVAAGIAPFARRPPEFSDLSPDIVSHTVDEPDLERFAGKRVAVIGGGQSALESAALLNESGAEATIVARRGVRFVTRRGPLHWGPMRLLHHPYEIGPGGLSHLVTMPTAFTRIPRPLQDSLAARAIRPVGAAWLEPRLTEVDRIEGRQVAQASTTVRGRPRLALSDGTAREFDHVLLATGYQIDIARYGFFTGGLLRLIRRVRGYPVLSPTLESSVPGLHFVGAASAWSCGPLVRFVCGTSFTAGRLQGSIAPARSARSGQQWTVAPVQSHDAA